MVVVVAVVVAMEVVAVVAVVARLLVVAVVAVLEVGAVVVAVALQFGSPKWPKASECSRVFDTFFELLQKIECGPSPWNRQTKRELSARSWK